MTLSRSATQDQDKWNVEALYPSYEAWEKAFQQASESPSKPRWLSLSALQGKLGESPATLLATLEKSAQISRELEKLHTYAHLRHDEDITDNTFKGAYQKIMALISDFEQESSWIEPEILALDPTQIDDYLRSDLLVDYKFHLEKIIRMRPHTLPADQEVLLAKAGRPLQAPPNAFSALNNADLKFGRIEDGSGEEHELTHGLYQLYLRSSDRVLRKNAFKQMHGSFKGFENTFSELLHGQIQAHLFNSEARSYSSCLEAALFSKRIPLSVYHSLIRAVRSGLGSLHRYVALRKKILGVSELHLYDLYVPLVPSKEIKMDYSQAEQLVIDSVAPLGTDYQSNLRQGLLEERWVDRFENKNKRSGAYSSGCFDSYPYILLNFKGILRDTFTLAHEAGHSMHSHLSRTHQPYHYSHYPIFVAEVASTFNEELLMHLMLDQTRDKEERLYLINEKMEDIRATLFRQTMFAEFELKIHELAESNTPITPHLLSELYHQLNVDYFGPEASIDEEISIEWARIPHFYYNFYVYQYATGISAALTLAEKVLRGDQTARDNYLAFLRSGSSLHPIDLLKLAGIDMTTPAPVESALKKFDTLLDEFETLAL